MFAGGDFFEGRSLWNINQIYLQAQFRVPYEHHYLGRGTWTISWTWTSDVVVLVFVRR